MRFSPMGETDAKADVAIDLLTPRERECLRLVDQHLSSKEIARQLGISKHTVDTHLDKARQRLGVVTRYDAARLMAARDRDAGGEGGALGYAPPLDRAPSPPPHPPIPDVSGGDRVGIAPGLDEVLDPFQ